MSAYEENIAWITENAYGYYRGFWIEKDLQWSSKILEWYRLDALTRLGLMAFCKSALEQVVPHPDEDGQDIIKLRALLAASNRELEAADQTIKRLREELKNRPEFEPSPPNIPLGDRVPWRSLRPLTRENIFRRIEAEAANFADMCADEWFSIRHAIDCAAIEEEAILPVGWARNGFPYKTKRSPGAWSLRGLDLEP